MKNQNSFGMFLRAFLVICLIMLAIEVFAKEPKAPNKDGSITLTKEEAQEVAEVIVKQQMIIEHLKQQNIEIQKALRSAKCI